MSGLWNRGNEIKVNTSKSCGYNFRFIYIWHMVSHWVQFALFEFQNCWTRPHIELVHNFSNIGLSLTKPVPPFVILSELMSERQNYVSFQAFTVVMFQVGVFTASQPRRTRNITAVKVSKLALGIPVGRLQFTVNRHCTVLQPRRPPLESPDLVCFFVVVVRLSVLLEFFQHWILRGLRHWRTEDHVD